MSPPLLMALPAGAIRLLLLLCFSALHCPSVFGGTAGYTVVGQLPGFGGPLPFHLETGYLGVDDADDVQLFYYFIQSARNPAEDPLLLWLTGGPGCSAFSGLAFEIGPLTFLKVRYNGSIPSLVLNPYSWTEVANVIFLDSPIGTGFSFARNPDSYKSGDIMSSEQVVMFMRKWFHDHPQFTSNSLYIAGDSHVGKVVPIIAHLIAEGVHVGDELLINLKGYLLGNPLTGEKVDTFSRVKFLCGMGIISDELYELVMKYCKDRDYDNPTTKECAKNLDIVKKAYSEINSAFTLEPRCPGPSPSVGESDRRSLQAIAAEYLHLECREYGYYLSYFWANSDQARDALHIQKGTVDVWHRCSERVKRNYVNGTESVIGYHRDLISKGYRALVYSGDHDAVIPFMGTQAWIRSLNLSIVDDWRPWFVDGQVGGYTRSYSNGLTFSTVKGAGHTAPEYKPKESLAMFRRWIAGEPL